MMTQDKDSTSGKIIHCNCVGGPNCCMVRLKNGAPHYWYGQLESRDWRVDDGQSGASR